jgi:beta-glucosidase
MTKISFPPDFLWGAATASYQIEGSAQADGKGESIWDRFSHTPGKISDGATGDDACDHYRRYREDVALMRELGLRAYRFSIAWPRILPEGKGRLEQRGLDFYARLLDELHAVGITPLPTLYHWDLPQGLEEKNGWANRDCAGWFADYAALIANKLGDRLTMISTFNEPGIFSTLGYLTGYHAPGLKDPVKFFRAIHHINLAHGLAVEAMRAEAPKLKIGTVLQLPPIHPRGDSPDDERAARLMDALMNRWWADPIFKGSYPADLLELVSPLVPIQEGDLVRIHQPLDFAGMNCYSRVFAYHDPKVPLLEAMIDESHRVSGADYTAMGWEVYPRCLSESLLRFKTEWGDPEVYITENGAAYDDHVVNGGVADDERIRYFQLYLAEVRRAMDAGVKVRGYFVWSLLDNFEWAHGFTKRFGLIHTDYATQRRTPKASAFWYQRLIGEGQYDL